MSAATGMEGSGPATEVSSTTLVRILKRGLALDLRLFEAAYARRGPRGTAWWMWLAAKSGDGPAYLALALVFYAADFPYGAPCFRALVSAFCIERVLYFSLKHLFRRARPYVRLSHVRNTINPLDRYSFPSGHAAGASLVATVVSYYYPPALLAAYPWAASVAYARVYHGVHYPADVVVGMLLGFSCGWIGLGLA